MSKSIRISERAYVRLLATSRYEGRTLTSVLERLVMNPKLVTDADGVVRRLESSPEMGSVGVGEIWATEEELMAAPLPVEGVVPKNTAEGTGVGKTRTDLGVVATSGKDSVSDVCGCGHLESMHRNRKQCQSIVCGCRRFERGG